METRLENRLNAAAKVAAAIKPEVMLLEITEAGVRCQLYWQPGTKVRKIESLVSWKALQRRTSNSPLLDTISGLMLKKKYSGVSG